MTNPNVSAVSGLELALFAVVIALVVGLALLSVQRSRWRHQDLTRDLGRDVATGLDLLRGRIAGLQSAAPEGPAAQALSDARNRLAAAEEMRGRGENLLVLKATRRILLEGLAAVQEGDRLAGRDTGPAVPAPTAARLVEHAVRVPVGDREHIAQPAYVPGYPYHFPGGDIGGDEVPGGWYAEPFWTSTLDPDG